MCVYVYTYVCMYVYIYIYIYIYIERERERERDVMCKLIGGDRHYFKTTFQCHDVRGVSERSTRPRFQHSARVVLKAASSKACQ